MDKGVELVVDVNLDWVEIKSPIRKRFLNKLTKQLLEEEYNFDYEQEFFEFKKGCLDTVVAVALSDLKCTVWVVTEDFQKGETTLEEKRSGTTKKQNHLFSLRR